MRRRTQGGKAGRRGGGRPRRLAPWLWPFPVCLLSLLAGCAGDNHARDDPLIGGGPPAAPGAPPTPSPAVGATAPVPPLPVASSALSTASIAGGNPLPGGRELRIDEPRGSLVKNPWKSPAENQAGAGATLRNPEPVITPVSRSTMDPLQGLTEFDRAGPPTAPAPVPPGGSAYEQLHRQLAARGMNWYRQEKWGAGVKFTCTIPRPKEPSRVRFYEAVAGTDVAAMQLVLEKIDREGRAGE